MTNKNCHCTLRSIYVVIVTAVIVVAVVVVNIIVILIIITSPPIIVVLTLIVIRAKYVGQDTEFLLINCYFVISELPEKRIVEFQNGVKVEVRFEHHNWLTNTINILIGVIDKGMTDRCNAYIYQLPNVKNFSCFSWSE